MTTKHQLRIVSDDGRLAEIVRLFDSGPDLIPVRDIGWLIDVAREVTALRTEVKKLEGMFLARAPLTEQEQIELFGGIIP